MQKTFAFVIAAGMAGLTPNAATANEQREYGEYLAGECTSCHRDGANETIPPIVGYDPESFIVLLESYKNGERDNQAMVSVAKSLDEEQIMALAVYFASVKPKE